MRRYPKTVDKPPFGSRTIRSPDGEAFGSAAPPEGAPDSAVELKPHNLLSYSTTTSVGIRYKPFPKCPVPLGAPLPAAGAPEGRRLSASVSQDLLRGVQWGSKIGAVLR